MELHKDGANKIDDKLQKKLRKIRILKSELSDMKEVIS
jgi:hypothetical protein